ncbi:MAG: energy-coupling factor transporter transmembrane protein EcfT [Caldisericia bacterium]|nr:energy-coupling factor transporter transmembrane protein EcfT [Caldisericia bacterium]
MQFKKSIAIGQYIPTGSFVHKLDVRFKMIFLIVFIVCIFFIHSIYGYLLFLGLLVLCILVSKIPLKYFLSALKPIIFLLTFTTILQLFFTSTGELLLDWWIFKVTIDGVYEAVFIFLRLILLVFASSTLTFTSTPMELTSSLEFILGPLKRVGFPVSEVSMMITIALRFVPTIMEETDRLMKAQSARGIDFDKGNLFQRIANLIPIIVPLFISALRRADELAIAMEARSFQVGVKRTHIHVLVFKKHDYIFIVTSLLFVILVCIYF